VAQAGGRPQGRPYIASVIELLLLLLLLLLVVVGSKQRLLHIISIAWCSPGHGLGRCAQWVAILVCLLARVAQIG
jgi:hypothetical protein